MSSSLPDRARRIVPRWRDASVSIELGELSSLRNCKDQSLALEAEQRSLKAAFLHTGLIEDAIDLLRHSILIEDEETAKEVAEEIEKAGISVPAIVRQQARRVTQYGVSPRPTKDSSQKSQEERIRGARILLRRDPANSLARIDLARAFTSLGMNKKAHNEARAALALGGSSRFIARSAARLLIHMERPDEALRVLRRSPLARSDPWIMAAEIATSEIANKKSALIDRGTRALQSESLSPFHLSELAIAVASMEHDNGKSRRARKLILQGLRNPTENSIAQAHSMHRKDPSLEAPSNDLIMRPYSYEARAWDFAGRGRWEDCVAMCKDWTLDEPFSGRPYILSSFIAAEVSADYPRVVEVARAGLKTNPRDPTLSNNLAFGLASMGQVDEAAESLLNLDGSDLTEADRIAITATRGLIFFKSGITHEGRSLYQEAIRMARKANNFSMMRTAQLHLLEQEACRVPDENRDALIREIQSVLSKDEDNKVLHALGNHILTALR